MILKRMMELSQQSPPRPKWSDRDRVAIFFTAGIDDDSQPQSTTDREALWHWELWIRKYDRRIVWPFSQEIPSQAEMPQIPPAILSHGKTWMASELFFWRNGIPWSLLGVIDLKQCRKGSCMTKIDRDVLLVPLHCPW